MSQSESVSILTLAVFQAMCCAGPGMGNGMLGKPLSPELESQWASGGRRGGNWVLGSVCRLRSSHLHSFCSHLQLPHMPHISECLMKRSLKPADLRDMTVGQLQVIVNDLHSQIESKCKRA